MLFCALCYYRMYVSALVYFVFVCHYHLALKSITVIIRFVWLASAWVYACADVLQRQCIDADSNSDHRRCYSGAGADSGGGCRHARWLQHGRNTGSEESLSCRSSRAVWTSACRLRCTSFLSISATSVAVIELACFNSPPSRCMNHYVSLLDCPRQYKSRRLKTELNTRTNAGTATIRPRELCGWGTQYSDRISVELKRRVVGRGRRSRGGHLCFVWCAFQVRTKSPSRPCYRPPLLAQSRIISIVIIIIISRRAYYYYYFRHR